MWGWFSFGLTRHRLGCHGFSPWSISTGIVPESMIEKKSTDEKFS